MERTKGFVEFLDIEITSREPGRAEGIMPIKDEYRQPFGFLHGGATITLLETVASFASEDYADFEKERPFGVDVHVRHRKSGKQGMLRGVAELDHVEGNKQFWSVVAYDDEGDVVSDGTVITKVVTLERLAQKEREREATRK